MLIRMWEAVAAPGRLADLEVAARAVVDGAPAGVRVEASSDGVSRVVITVAAQEVPPALDEALPAELYQRAAAWTFTRL